jgi:lysophospholipase L1-like esterase
VEQLDGFDPTLAAASTTRRRGLFGLRFRSVTLILGLVVFVGVLMGSEFEPLLNRITSATGASDVSVSSTPMKVLTGYGVVSTSGVVATFGGAGFHGDRTTALNSSVVAITATSDAEGYWLVTSAGEVLSYGDAVSYGSAHETSASGPIVSMAATHDGKGYWLVSSSGQVFSFGDAVSYAAKTGQTVSGSIVGMAVTSDGAGYWLVTSAGEVLSYGDAVSYGSAHETSASGPIVSMAATHDGKGYWLVSSSGQVFSFGDAVSYAAKTGQTVSGSIVGMAVTSDGAGYILVASDGGVFAFGDASSKGSDVNPAESPNEPSDFTDDDPPVVGVVYLASGHQASTTGSVKVTYFGDSLAWLNEIYSDTVAGTYDESVADAATPGCGIAGDEELTTSASGNIDPPAACSDWYQRLAQALASEHPDVVVVELGYWESQSHLWDGKWATLTDDPAYAAAVRSNLASVIALIRSEGAVPVLLTSPYYGDGTSNVQVDAWNSILKSTARASGVTVLNLNSVLDPTGSFETIVNGIDTRTSDGVHLTMAGVTKVIDPWLLPIIERLGHSAQ